MVGGEENPFLDTVFSTRSVCDATHFLSSACSLIYNNKMSRLARHLALFLVSPHPSIHKRNQLRCTTDPGLTVAPFFVLAVSLGSRSFPSFFPESCVCIQLLVKTPRATPCVCARDTTMHNAAFMSVSSFAYCSPGLRQTPGHLVPLLFLLCTTQPCKHIS